MEAGGMKKNTGQLWKSQYIISDRTLYYRTQKNGLCSDETAGRI